MEKIFKDIQKTVDDQYRRIFESGKMRLLKINHMADNHSKTVIEQIKHGLAIQYKKDPRFMKAMRKLADDTYPFQVLEGVHALIAMPNAYLFYHKREVQIPFDNSAAHAALYQGVGAHNFYAIPALTLRLAFLAPSIDEGYIFRFKRIGPVDGSRLHAYRLEDIWK